MNPLAPVTRVRPLRRTCSPPMPDPLLNPFPAVLAIEPSGALREPGDVPPAFLRGAAAVVHDYHRRHIGASGDAVQAHAPIEVLEIEEIARVESARRVDRFPPRQHEA